MMYTPYKIPTEQSDAWERLKTSYVDWFKRHYNVKEDNLVFPMDKVLCNFVEDLAKKYGFDSINPHAINMKAILLESIRLRNAEMIVDSGNSLETYPYKDVRVGDYLITKNKVMGKTEYLISKITDILIDTTTGMEVYHILNIPIIWDNTHLSSYYPGNTISESKVYGIENMYSLLKNRMFKRINVEEIYYSVKDLSLSNLLIGLKFITQSILLVTDMITTEYLLENPMGKIVTMLLTEEAYYQRILEDNLSFKPFDMVIVYHADHRYHPKNILRLAENSRTPVLEFYQKGR